MIPTLARFANAARQAAKEALNARSSLSAYPVIQKCPSPTCECAEMPPDLDIDQTKALDGTMAAHSGQVLIATGQADWTSKIEDEKENAPWGEFAFEIKKILGRGGEYHDPYNNVAINTCSFEEPKNAKAEGVARAFLFPSFRMVDQIKIEHQSAVDFVKTFLLPQKLHAEHSGLSEEERARMTSNPMDASSKNWEGKSVPISAPTIVVCSHHSRDSRCGVLGPLLHAEFEQYINKRHTLRNKAVPQGSPGDSTSGAGTRTRTYVSHPEFRPKVIDPAKGGIHPVNVGMISHVGGHAWAGNVVVYIPPDYCCNPVERVKKGAKPQDVAATESEKVVDEEERGDEILEEERSPLAGKTIWYGRVQPKHVEGIVEQTIGHGKIIGELFRGGLNADGSYLRI